jgi:hypothetical protein
VGDGTWAAEPITIGLGMALTGGLAAVGKSGLLAMQIWVEDVNAKDGLLGRSVTLGGNPCWSDIKSLTSHPRPHHHPPNAPGEAAIN